MLTDWKLLRDQLNIMGTTTAPYAPTADDQPSTGAASWRGMMIGIIRKVDPLPTPAAKKSTSIIARNGKNWVLSVGWVKKVMAMAAAMSVTAQAIVTRAPPSLSEIQ